MSILTANAPASRGAVISLLRRLHFYIGLFVAPFIFVAALTGVLYVLTPQIENMLYADALTVEPQGAPKPLSAQIAAARASVGQTEKIYAVRPAPGATDTTRVQFVSPGLGASESRSVFINPYTLQVKGDMTVYGTSGVLPLRMWIDQLHRGLLLGDFGRNYSELAASWLWIAALGGLALWLSARPRRQKKKAQGRFAVARHWHITLGLILLLGLLFFSATGLTWSQWAGDNVNKMRTALGWLTPQVTTTLDRSAPAAPVDPHADHHASMGDMDMSGMPVKKTDGNRADGDWDHVLSAARAAGIEADKLELRQPKNAGSAWTVTEIDRSWPTRVDAVSVRPDNFAIIDHVRFKDFPLVAKLTRWGVDAHMGILFGLANQLILAAFGLGLCAMIALGYRMWWLRRPAAPSVNPSQTLVASWLALPHAWKAAVFAVALALGYCLPVMGVSLLMFMAVDIVRWERQDRAAARSPKAPEVQRKISAQPVAVGRKEKRHFLIAVSIVALIAGSVITQAIVGGAIDQYHIPFSDWSLQLYVTQIMMIVLYTGVFTGLFTVPLWYFFLGEKSEPQP